MKPVKCLIFPAVTFLVLFALNSVFPQANVLWHSIHKGPIEQGFFPVKMAVDGNGNVYITGTSISGSGGDLTAYLDITTVRYNSAGVLQWQRIAGNQGYKEDDGTSILLDNRNNVFVFGYSYDTVLSKTTGLVIKYTAEGELLWKNRISDFNTSSDAYRNFRQLVIDSEQNIYVFWNSYDYGVSYGPVSVNIFKFSNAGNLIWRYRDTIDTRNFMDYRIESFQIDRQNNIVFSGFKQKYNEPGKTFLKKISPDGNILFDRIIKENSGLYLTQIQTDIRNNYFITGQSDSTYTIKVTNNGNTIWCRSFPKYSGNYGIYDDKPCNLVTIDGNIIASNISSPSAGTNVIVTVKYDQNGDTLWKRSYSHGTSPYNSLSSVCEDKQGCIYVCGSSRGAPYINGDFFVILKYSPSGKLLREIRNLNSPFPYYGNMRDFIMDNIGNMYITSEVMITQYQGYEYGLTAKYAPLEDTITENVYPSNYVLHQNYPNPFNASTSVEFELPLSSFVNISVYNSLGQKVAVMVNGNLDKGYHYYNWNASNLSSGIYYYIFRAGDYSDIKKMALIK